MPRQQILQNLLLSLARSCAFKKPPKANLENAILKTNALSNLSQNEFYILSTDTHEIVHRIEGTEPKPPIADAEPETA